jgi:hypothetical protein
LLRLLLLLLYLLNAVLSSLAGSNFLPTYGHSTTHRETYTYTSITNNSRYI